MSIVTLSLLKSCGGFFFLLKSRGGCNPVESRGGFFLFNGYSNFIPV
jgi:hypothetical protein